MVVSLGVTRHWRNFRLMSWASSMRHPAHSGAEGIGKPWNITEHVRDSVDLLVGFKGSGVKEPDTYLKQVNMLTGRAPVQDFSKQAIALFRMALDAKKGEYVKAFESYLKNAKLSPEAGNIPGVAKPQDKAFRDASG